MNQDNKLNLDDFEEWVASGKSLRDASCGLMFAVVDIANESGGDDLAIPIYLSLAQTCAILHAGEELNYVNRPRAK